MTTNRLMPVSVIVSLLMAGLVPATAAGRRVPPEGEGRVFPAVAGWTFAPPPGDSIYTSDNLWNIIDGGAELFLSYGFVDLRIGEYTDASGTDVRVELYRHNSKTNAFGIYSQERNPGYRFIPLGTQGYIEDGTMNFLCGTYYVKVSSHRAGKAGRDAMEKIGRSVAEHLRQEPGWPAQLAIFPPEKKTANAEGFIGQNFLGYRFFRAAFTAKYAGGETLFLMEFPSAAKAREAADAYLKAIGDTVEVPGGKITRVADLYNGPVLLLLRGRLLAGAYGAGATALSRTRMELLNSRIPHGE